MQPLLDLCRFSGVSDYVTVTCSVCTSENMIKIFHLNRIYKH